MSLRLPSRRITQTARTAISGKASLHLQYLQPRTQRRHVWYGWLQPRTPKPSESPVLQAMSKKDRQAKAAERMMNRTQGATIFDEEIKDATPGEGQDQDPKKKKKGKKAANLAQTMQDAGFGATTVKEHMERALDPDPRWRIRYQRKKIMQMVRADGELTREQRLKMSEKEVKSKSENLPTSTKKLVMLSHQIVGKTVDEAITQMRFSKKKMAREMKWQLEEARDQAIVARGMGLGARNGEVLRAPKQIQTKDGKWIEVQDPTRLYVDQSWVNKGPYRGVRRHYRARGRMSVMWRPGTSVSIILKEEKTRIRQHEEKVEKQAKKTPWIHLPSRPVTAQRPYYSW